MKRFFNKGCSVLPKNRNVLTAAALAFNADWILMNALEAANGR